MKNKMHVMIAQSCLLFMWAYILILVSATDEPDDVRLVGGNSNCSGTLEMRSQGEWKPVDVWHQINWMTSAVVCRQLDCGSAVSTKRMYGSTYKRVWKITSCVGSSLGECGYCASDFSRDTVELICSDSVRLVNGTSSCSGRVEVKSNQSWVSVCEGDFDQQDAEVLCRELGCNAPSVLLGALYGEVKAPMWTKEFQCEGSESVLLNCRTSDSTRNTCSPDKTVGLTCSVRDDVRLVGGTRNCSGRLEMNHQGEWRPVVGWSDWNPNSTAVVCRQLNCGSAVLTEHTYGFPRESVWKVRSSCVGSESSLRECVRRRSSTSVGRLEVICLESVKFVNETSLCSGRVEVKSNQSWVSVCEESNGVRLVGGTSSCTGRLEMKHRGEWRRVDEWYGLRLTTTAVVCRQLDCGSAVSSFQIYDITSEPVWRITSACVGSESSLRECATHVSDDSYDRLEVTCSESVRLVNGTGLCSGRVEVKSNQSWVSVCEGDFDQQDAEVVCRELGCGSPSVLQGALYGEAKAPMWTKEFQCEGNESALLDCGTSNSTRNTCSPDKTVGLTCSETVRLVGGTSHCAGRLEAQYEEEWRPVVGWSNWDLKSSSVVCRQLGCGSAVSTRRSYGSTPRPVWLIRSYCDGSESSMRECGLEQSDISSGSVKVICSESVRLVNGTSSCSGRVEVKSNQSWVSVCLGDFDQQDAEVVCRELGCGAPSVLQGALYGEANAPMWTKEFQCEGNESALLDCGTSNSTRNTCSPAKTVGLTCSEFNAVRLVGGTSKCTGSLEMKHRGEWRPLVVGSDWNLKSAAVAQLNINTFHRAGDLVLGGLFSTHRYPVYPDLSFTSKPREPTCHGFFIPGFRQAQSLAFAVTEINRNGSLLPNVTLGYRIYDTCHTLRGAFHAALSLVSGREERFRLDEGCAAGSPPVMGIVGADSSTHSIAISSVLGLYREPQVSYYSTCSCLSDRRRFPSFFRTIPSDAFQVNIQTNDLLVSAMLQIMRRLGWAWVGLVILDNDYGHHAARSFQADLARSGRACLAYVEVLPMDSDPAQLQRIVSVMKTSTARVVIAFVFGSRMAKLMEEVVRQNVTGLQWMASEGWTTNAGLQTPGFMPYLRGTLGIAIRRGEMPGLRDFLLDIHPDREPGGGQENNIVRQFWENTFGCKFAPLPSEWLDAGGGVCTGREDLATARTDLLDVSDFRPEYNVYKAVYALAHALQDMLQCAPGRGPFTGGSCARLEAVQPWQLVHYLEKVKFTTSFGDHVSFDENGDPLPIYDVMNWAWLPDGSAKVQNVGVVRKSASAGEELILHEDRIFWNFESKKPPRSVCSESCSPGTRVARRKGQPVCCFDCIACSEGEISNETDSTECTSCPEDFWSSPQRDRCVPKSTEFLSYHDALGISLTTISLLGTLMSAVVLGIFVYHRDTAVVRANNSELSFQLLLSLKLCFMCSLLFIGRPRMWTCQLRHAAFGISFVWCVACVLVKTMVVLAVFRASKPGGADIMKWFGAVQQRATVLPLISIQGIICTVWIVSASPTPHKNTKYYSDKIVYECDVGSTVGFAVLLGYIGLLALLSFILAFMARNLPDNFNEAKLITFSMLIFCAVWIAFIPAYISSPGKYADVVEVFAILASSFGLLVALFGPKCYIILLKPERNTKKSIMGHGATIR